jgi:hypothetical protein
MKEKEHYRESCYRPLSAKTLRVALKSFIRREFPRLGGPWVIDKFVDKLLEIVDQYRFFHGKLIPGQVVWPAVKIDDPPVYRKPIASTHQIPAIITIVNQDDVEALRNNADRQQLLKQAIVRAANDAYAQGGVLSCTDLGLLFQRSNNRVAEIIRKYETETGDVVPRRGNIHDMGRTVTHKSIICRKAYLEGKVTPQIALETCHSPEAVDNYVLDFARVFFATIQRSMSIDETVFAIQRPRYLVQEYVRLIQEFGLDQDRVFERAGVQMEMKSDQVEPAPLVSFPHIERREQAPIAE